MWETAKNLWLNWGTTNFWVSSLVAALVGMFVWWGIGAIAYLSAPRKTKARKGNFRDFIRPQFYLQQKYRGPQAHGDFNGDHLSDCRNSQLCLALGYRFTTHTQLKPQFSLQTEVAAILLVAAG